MPMPASPSTLMRDDSLAARLFQGHDYKRSLVGDSLVGDDPIRDMAHQSSRAVEDSGSVFFDNVADFFSSIPWVVYAILGIILIAFLFYRFYQEGLLRSGQLPIVKDEDSDDIYEIDYDVEIRSALEAHNYSSLVRLLYLRTLRILDERGRISWRISKTPMEYANEMGSAPFLKMTHHFLRVRYGHFEADETLYQTMSALQEEVLKGGEA